MLYFVWLFSLVFFVAFIFFICEVEIRWYFAREFCKTIAKGFFVTKIRREFFSKSYSKFGSNLVLNMTDKSWYSLARIVFPAAKDFNFFSNMSFSWRIFLVLFWRCVKVVCRESFCSWRVLVSLLLKNQNEKIKFVAN